jgi:threonine synthase
VTDSPEVEFDLVCPRCGASFALQPLVTGCPACGNAGAISVPEIRHRPQTTPVALTLRRGAPGLRRYADLLPGGPHADRISLGEGGTPLVRSRIIGPRLGLGHLYFKNEAANPTWSFKDRYVAVTINLARAFGYRRAVVSSTGNLGVSAAAYCAAAGIDCLFLAPPDTAGTILHQARLYAHAYS